MTWRPRQRGSVLLGTYLLLSVCLIFSNAMLMRGLAQQRFVNQHQDRVQAVNVAQAAAFQLKEDLYFVLATLMYQQQFQGQAIPALQWLDTVGTGTESPMFDVPPMDTNHDGILTRADGDGIRDATSGNPIVVPLAGNQGSAWIASVTNPDGGTLSPRLVTIMAQAQVGGVTKQLRVTYTVALGLSDIFRYAYFINNYGWFQASNTSGIIVNGEVRSNGDLRFSGNMNRIFINGDLYASSNPELKDPLDPLQPATGTITGDPNQINNLSDYWNWKTGDTWMDSGIWSSAFNVWQARPARRLTFPDEPAINGDPKELDHGWGYDTDTLQQRFAQQPTKDMPYLGNLSIYKQLAEDQNSSLTYYDAAAGQTKTISNVYEGPDDKGGNADDTAPLVLVGTNAQPIVLNGPVVVPGDVIIKGVVQGRGTIFAGRNIHIVGETIYKDPPMWLTLGRDAASGEINREGRWQYSYETFGIVCNGGAYVPPGQPAPGGCM